MAKTTVEIVADSNSKAGIRLTTFSLKYPRIIHGELMTHRVFSRNSSSSRAVPVSKMIKEIEDDPFIPEVFLKNQKGMQAVEPIQNQLTARVEWLNGRDAAVRTAKNLLSLNIHKEYVNRVLEPFSFISVVLTATDFNNWFALRYHPHAQPEIQELAKLMWEKYSSASPKFLSEGEWHLPYVHEHELSSLPIETNKIRSVARCARVSYKTHEGKEPSYQEDYNLFTKLVGSTPVHASPAEHQAMATGDPNIKSGNFKGWIQYRQTLPNHTAKEFSGVKVEY